MMEQLASLFDEEEANDTRAVRGRRTQRAVAAATKGSGGKRAA